MEDLFAKLVKRKRCSPDDFERARAKVARGEKSERQIVAEWRAFDLPRGAVVWLTGVLKGDGEQCKIESSDFFATMGRIHVRRVCSGKPLVVRSENIANMAPGSSDSCFQILFRALGRDPAERILQYVTCQRCWMPCTVGSTCQVEHRRSKREIVGRGRLSSNVESERLKYLNCRCTACRAELRYFFGENGRFLPLPRWSRFCFEGNHTICPLPPADNRTNVRPDASLFALSNPNLQSELCELPDYVSSLDISRCDLNNIADEGSGNLMQVIDVSNNEGIGSDGGSYNSEDSDSEDTVDDSIDPAFFYHGLPNLKRLHSSVSQVTLIITKDSFPALEELWLEDNCFIDMVPGMDVEFLGHILLPRLRSLILEDMLCVDFVREIAETSTMLEKVKIAYGDFYHGGDFMQLHFASKLLEDLSCVSFFELTALSLSGNQLSYLNLVDSPHLNMVTLTGKSQAINLKVLHILNAGPASWTNDVLEGASMLESFHLHGSNVRNFRISSELLRDISLAGNDNLEDVSFSASNLRSLFVWHCPKLNVVSPCDLPLPHLESAYIGSCPRASWTDDIRESAAMSGKTVHGNVYT